MLKAGIRNNTHDDKHITAVEDALRKDWILQLSYLHEFATRSDENDNGALRGMLRLMVGEDSLSFPTDGVEYK